MLRKDRREPKDSLKALQYAEYNANLSQLLANNNKFIPKRKYNTIGKRLVDHAINAYEFARFANHLEPDDEIEKAERLNAELKACKESLDLCSDIRLLPAILNIPITDKRIENLTSSAVRTNKYLTRWYNKDRHRYNKNETSPIGDIE